MASAVLMPKAGISVESCIIGSWKKKVGDTVKTGDILFDYETDKAAFECESTADGLLLDIFCGDGDEVPCLTAVCVVGNEGEDISSFKASGGSGSDSGETAARDAQPSLAASAAVQASAEAGASSAKGTAEKAGAVSPRARNAAEKLGVDISAADGTGPYGRIIERDIAAAAESAKTGSGIGGRNFGAEGAPAVQSAPRTAEASVSRTAAADDFTDEKLTQIRRTIAKAMQRSLSETAQLTHHHSCDATAISDLRRKLKQAGEANGLDKISINDMVLFAVSRTLKKYPGMNAHLLNGDTLRSFTGVHLGMAVDTPRGLMVPTIFGADKLSLAEISRTAKELASMAKSGSISPDLLQGATFTVSNLGSLGVEMFTPIINPPQVAILGVCGITTKVRIGASGIEAYPSMGLSVTYDHRAVDGAPASKFAQELADNLSNFDLMLAL
jgi:pyruvate dehydrogenase E2 component (dihydrolipoamide acetyltransferase)